MMISIGDQPSQKPDSNLILLYTWLLIWECGFYGFLQTACTRMVFPGPYGRL